MGQIDEALKNAPAYDPQAAAKRREQYEQALANAPPEHSSALRRVLGDQVGINLIGKGAIGAGEALAGLANLATFGGAGKLLDAAGYDPQRTRAALEEWYSPEQKAANQEVAQARGFVPTLGALVRNPSTIVGTVAESVPSMLGGAGAARAGIGLALRAGKTLSPVVAGALGEGVVSAGQNAEQIRQDEPDKTLSAGQAALAVGSGALTGAIGYGAGKLANKLGIGDVQTMLAQGKLGAVGADAAQAGAKKGMLRKMGEGILTEGVLEELPQSAQEQVAQNLAQGKPWDEGVAEAAAQGLVAGAVMGAGGAPLHGGEHGGGNGGAASPHADAGAAAFAAGQPMAAPDDLKSVAAKAQWVKGWQDAQQQSHSEAAVESAQQAALFRADELDREERGVTDLQQSLAVPQTPDPSPAAERSRRNAEAAAQRNAEIQAAESLDEEIRQSTGATERSPSQRMGLDPADGTLSSAAALAVDSGAHHDMLARQSPAGSAESGGQSAAAPTSVQEGIAQARARHAAATAVDSTPPNSTGLDGAAQTLAAPSSGQEGIAQARALRAAAPTTSDADSAPAMAQSSGSPDADAQPTRAALNLTGNVIAPAGDQPLQSPADNAALPAPPATAPRLQNRDRSSAASVAQMNAIAANPDYLRAGPSRTMDQGAPVVFGDVPASAVMGRAETVADGRGDRVGTRYAVVEAGDIITSHQADGTPVADYADGLPGKLRAVAGNGRAAGLTEAHRRGTTDAYRQELLADAPGLGLDAGAIGRMKAPVLVRVMRGEDVTSDIGDRSNTVATQRLSPVEEAANDAQRVDLSALAFTDDGRPTHESITGFIAALPESERGDMMNADGTPTRQAVDRLMAAVFKHAYDSDALVQLYAQATDPQARTVMAALADAAGDLSLLRGAGEFDIRAAVADAASMAVNATRKGLKLADLVKNRDLDMSPEAFIVAEFMAENIRSGKRIAEGLRNVARLAMEQIRIVRDNATQGGMFGDRPTLTRQQILESLKHDRENQQSTQHATDAAQVDSAHQRGAGLFEGGAQSAAADGRADAGGPADGRERSGAGEPAEQRATGQRPDNAAPVNARAEGWRTNYLRAAKVARELGIAPQEHKTLADLLAAIDRADAASQAQSGDAPDTQAAPRGVLAKLDAVRKARASVPAPGRDGSGAAVQASQPDPQAPTFVRQGDFWNYSGPRAAEIAKVLGMVTSRNGLVGIPEHLREQAAQALREAGIEAAFEGHPQNVSQNTQKQDTSGPPVAADDTRGGAQDLLGQAPNASQQSAEGERVRRAQREQQQRNGAPDAGDFRLAMDDARMGREVDPGQNDLPLFSRAAPKDGESARQAGRDDAHKARVLQGEPVATVRVEDVPQGGYADLEKWVAGVFAKQGGKAISPEIGEVALDERSAKTSLAHGGANQPKKAAFAAVKDVIEKGALVLRANENQVESFYFSAPVSISGRDNIVTVLVRRDQNTQRMYLHSVALKESLLNPRVSSVIDAEAPERSGSTNSGDGQSLPKTKDQGKASSIDVARESGPRVASIHAGYSRVAPHHPPSRPPSARRWVAIVIRARDTCARESSAKVRRGQGKT